MNVALMVNSLGFGGAERIIADLSVHLEKKGFTVFVFVMNNREVAYPYGGTLVPLGLFPVPDGPLSALFTWQYFLSTARLKRKHKIDTTISAMEYLNLVNLMTGRDRKITSIHNYRFQYEVTPSVKDRLIEWALSKLTRRNNKIVCVSRAIEEKARGLYGPDAPLTTIYNSVDIDRLSAMITQPPDGPDIEIGPRTFVNAGRLCAQKAQDRLLHAFALVHEKHPDARLLILGGGADEEQLRALTASLGITEAVTFTGFVHNPTYYIARCHTFVLSSEYEGFGNVILESMVCGTPVISTDCRSGPREILAPQTPMDAVATGVEYAEWGILTPLDPASLAEAMVRMLEDEEMHARYARAAAVRVADFASEPIVDQWTALLEEEAK